MLRQLSFKDKKTLLKTLTRIDSTQIKSEEQNYSIPVLKVCFEYGDKVETLPLVGIMNSNSIDGSLLKLNNGDVNIAIGDGFFKKCMEEPNYYPVMLAVIGHELGHYINGHLGQGIKCLDSINENLWDLAVLDEIKESRYYTNVVKQVVKGQINPIELEADLMAAKFVGVDVIIKMHLLTIEALDNPLSVIEKLNRIRLLVNLELESNIAKLDNYNINIIGAED